MFIKVFLCITLGLFVGFVGVRAGQLTDIAQRQPLEVKNGCAYYDMDSGLFTWGQRPMVVTTLPDEPSGIKLHNVKP